MVERGADVALELPPEAWASSSMRVGGNRGCVWMATVGRLVGACGQRRRRVQGQREMRSRGESEHTNFSGPGLGGFGRGDTRSFGCGGTQGRRTTSCGVRPWDARRWLWHLGVQGAGLLATSALGEAQAGLSGQGRLAPEARAAAARAEVLSNKPPTRAT
jgi:hypothetical protein